MNYPTILEFFIKCKDELVELLSTTIESIEKEFNNKEFIDGEKISRLVKHLDVQIERGHNQLNVLKKLRLDDPNDFIETVEPYSLMQTALIKAVTYSNKVECKLFTIISDNIKGQLDGRMQLHLESLPEELRQHNYKEIGLLVEHAQQMVLDCYQKISTISNQIQTFKSMSFDTTIFLDPCEELLNIYNSIVKEWEDMLIKCANL
jgi:hypothetical protein